VVQSSELRVQGLNCRVQRSEFVCVCDFTHQRVQGCTVPSEQVYHEMGRRLQQSVLDGVVPVVGTHLGFAFGILAFAFGILAFAFGILGSASGILGIAFGILGFACGILTCTTHASARVARSLAARCSANLVVLVPGGAVQVFGLRVSGFGFWVLGFGFWVLCFGFCVWGFGF
jgi:hypothetical protein